MDVVILALTLPNMDKIPRDEHRLSDWFSGAENNLDERLGDYYQGRPNEFDYKISGPNLKSWCGFDFIFYICRSPMRLNFIFWCILKQFTT